MWSGGCDIVCVVPEVAYDYDLRCTTSRFRAKRVSYYDRQVRTQAELFETLDGYSPSEAPCDSGSTGWVKVNGPAGFAAEEGQESEGMLFFVEAFMQEGIEQRPRRIVGRSFGAGPKDISVADDTVQVQTMTGQSGYGGIKGFVGIGVCCAEQWCD